MNAPTAATGKIEYRPLVTTSTTNRTTDLDDQEIVWQMLMHAAHETSIEIVKNNPLLQPYAQHFGQQPGDIGVVALATASPNPIPVGAAWVRFLPGVGFATSHLTLETNKEEYQTVRGLPELAIACLPEYRGMGIGSNLLKSLISAVQQQQPQYAGICLSCRTDNKALQLYERIGFVKVTGSELTNRAGGVSVTMKYMFDKEDA